jgi:hypothetical protein
MSEQPGGKPCQNCNAVYNPLRKGRCQRCYQYWRKHGVEHPGSLLKCTCGSCDTCRSRENARRRYHGLTYTVKAAGRYRVSRFKMDRSDLAVLGYVAGLIDGEGCITLDNNCWRVQIAMTDQPVIEWLGNFGGTVRERKVKGNRKRCWRWLVMRQSEVLDLLSAVLPFMRVKRNQAQAAIDDILYREQARFIPRSEYAE